MKEIKNNLIKSIPLLLLGTVLSVIGRAWVAPGLSLSFHIISTLLSFCVIAIAWSVSYSIHLGLNRKMPFVAGTFKRLFVQMSISFMLGLLLFGILFYTVMIRNTQYFTPQLRVASFIFNILTFQLISAIHIGVDMFQQWKKSLIEKAELEREKAIVQYDNIKNQINPHFLFNSLSSLESLIFQDQKLAANFLHQLTKVYRYVLTNKESVPLSHELDFTEQYIFLLKSRFNSGLHFNIHSIPNHTDFRVVPVTLQILIENALKHNVVGNENPLTLEIYLQDAWLVVRNNLQEKKAIGTSNKIGLENLTKLYKQLTGKNIIIEKTATYFSVSIPMIE